MLTCETPGSPASQQPAHRSVFTETCARPSPRPGLPPARPSLCGAREPRQEGALSCQVSAGVPRTALPEPATRDRSRGEASSDTVQLLTLGSGPRTESPSSLTPPTGSATE